MLKFGQQHGCYVWIRIQVPKGRSIVVEPLIVYEKVEGMEDDLTQIFALWTMIVKKESKEKKMYLKRRNNVWRAVTRDLWKDFSRIITPTTETLEVMATTK